MLWSRTSNKSKSPTDEDDPTTIGVARRESKYGGGNVSAPASSDLDSPSSGHGAAERPCACAR
jgi:hypothetical protein